MRFLKVFLPVFLLIYGCADSDRYDLLIRNGKIVDGSGSPVFTGDVGIRGDTIAAIGDLKGARGRTEFDAQGMVVAPGFINMLSWAVESLIEDGRSMSDIYQGVTLEVLGEGDSWGPWSNSMKLEMMASQGDIKYDIEWTTLGEYLEYLEKRGISSNIASFVGTSTLRIHQVGYDNRPPTTAEMDSMKLLARQAMEEGAIGISSALEYIPASFASTEELTELCRVAAEYDGMYISHIRNEDDTFLEAIDDFLRIPHETGIRAEIYHLKQVGRTNWGKLDGAIAKIDSARAAGLHIIADMYNYPASSTGLGILMPEWVQEGGFERWVDRLEDPGVRKIVGPEILKTIMRKQGSPDRVLVIGFNTDSLKYLQGKTLSEIASMRGKSPEETVMDLVIDDGSNVSAVFFSMSEDNLRKQIAQPWMSFGSDGKSMAPEGVFLKSATHPRAYGNFARLLGKYVRDEQVIPLEEAVRRLTTLPATNMKIEKRGALKEGYYADVVIFDPEKVQDHSTFEDPHQLSTGMSHVFVNGVQVLLDGKHTGATPGRVVRGPGYKERK
ncbi:MAG: D-aminoacylase [Bacteroidales bacterium]|nr:D-aminoacylase [Bacteroidales bacterium]MDT8373379.1 D-aminoacylase [Bacteroidales bacterium]